MERKRERVTRAGMGTVQCVRMSAIMDTNKQPDKTRHARTTPRKNTRKTSSNAPAAGSAPNKHVRVAKTVLIFTNNSNPLKFATTPEHVK